MPIKQEQLRASRSGRFKFEDATDDGKLIIKDRPKSLYRIYNSRLNNFVVSNGTADLELTIGNSIDIFLSGDVFIKTTEMDPVPVSGIYDELKDDLEIRTGRVRIRTNQNPSTKRVVLALTGQTTKLYYRFFNSGDNTFRIWKGATGATPVADLEPNQSLDLGVSETIYWISSTNPYEAIYEMIGKAS